MSRYVILALVAPLATPVVAQDHPAMTHYLERTRAAIVCEAPSEEEIVVCGRRAADRYRTPIVVRDAGDPAIVDALAERGRLIAGSTPCQDRGPFLIGCGSVGVTVSSALAPGGRPKLRPLAP